MARRNLSLAPVIDDRPVSEPPSNREVDATQATPEAPSGPPAPGRISQPPTRAKKTGGRSPTPHVHASGKAAARRRLRHAGRSDGRALVHDPSLAPITKRREILGIFLLALGVLCTMALWSYRPNDGPWALPKQPTHNWVGPAGAMLADGLIAAFGLGSHLLSLGLVAVGIRCFSRRPFSPSVAQVGGALLTLVSGAIMSHLTLKGTGALPYAPGGLVGALCGDGLAKVFSAPGTAVIAGATFAAGLVVSTDLSLGRLLRAFTGLFERGVDKAREAWEVRQETRRVRAQWREQALAALAKKVEEEEQEDAEARVERHEKRKKNARLKAELNVEREQREVALANREVQEPEIPGLDDPHLAGPAIIIDGNVTQPGLPLLTGDEPAVEITASPSANVVPLDRNTIITPPPEGALEAEEEQPEPPAPDAVGEPNPEPEIVILNPRPKKPAPAEQKDMRPKPFGGSFRLPGLDLLQTPPEEELKIDREQLNESARMLIKTFKDFGIEGYVREIRPGPLVTTYEFTPTGSKRVREIAGYADDLAMKLEAKSVRIVAPIPGKNAVGVEIPNERRQNVYLKDLISHPDFMRAQSKLALALGKDIEGKPVSADLGKMPHLLIAGTTGSGKSVGVNGMILSLLFKATPDEVRLLMIDPKMLELKPYDGIPHLLLPPVTDPKKAALALRWAVEEMERRYQLLADFGVRDIQAFNKKMARLKAAEDEQKLSALAARAADPEVVSSEEAGATVEEEQEDGAQADQKAIKKNGGAVPEKLPFIVIVVDEFADLMMVASKDVETYVARLAQKARASGIHVMLATQRPSVDVITGLIKANFPTRISFKVSSVHDSKTIINTVGAERLLGNGDMLMIPPGTSELARIHGGFVSEDEVARVVSFWKAQGKPQYNEEILRAPEGDEEGGSGGGGDDEPTDEFFDQAVDIVARTRKVSISEIQRKLGVGYNRAAKMVERMEREGMIGPSPGANKPREVYLRPPDA
jgi:S-DNA-T family DNA segregation ATPase FtsK/SpoIIIE